MGEAERGGSLVAHSPAKETLSKARNNQPEPTKGRLGLEQKLPGLRALARCFSKDWGRLGTHMETHTIHNSSLGSSEIFWPPVAQTCRQSSHSLDTKGDPWLPLVCANTHIIHVCTRKHME